MDIKIQYILRREKNEKTRIFACYRFLHGGCIFSLRKEWRFNDVIYCVFHDQSKRYYKHKQKLNDTDDGCPHAPCF